MKYNHVTELIGNTPLLRIHPDSHGFSNVEIYAKLEYYNPFGSVKDRIAWGMIKDDIAAMQRQKQTIVEASSGNTAKALTILASVFGLQFKTITNRIRVTEVKNILRLLGATIEELPGLSDCPNPNAPDDMLRVIERLVSAQPDKYYYTSQYFNQKNIDTHYQTTGKEIQTDLQNVDIFAGSLGTTGSTRGTGMYLKEHNPSLRLIGVVAAENDYIPGMRVSSEMSEVGLFEKDFYNRIITVDAKQATAATLCLVRDNGILCGPTSGAAYAGLLEYLRKQKSPRKKQTAVFIVCDRIEPYVSYFQKRCPELFGQPKQRVTLTNIPEKDIAAAPSMSVTEAAAHKGLIIDIRGNMAFRLGHIAGSINISAEVLEDLVLRGSPFSKTTPILIACAIGDQSAAVCALLRNYNYQAFHIHGGILAWREAHFPLTTIQQET